MQVGIMQGRLSPPQGSQPLQFFPRDWQAEFSLAKSMGFNSIEWAFDDLANPFSTTAGRAKLRSVSEGNSLFVKSICADYFMKECLTKENPKAVSVLVDLLEHASSAGIPLLMVPFVEGNLPETDTEFDQVVTNLREALGRDAGQVNLALEVDLPAERISALIEAIDSPRVGVCYDTGNAMTFGFDVGADIRKLGKLIKEVHIKDRIKGTRQSVYLGEGSVDFPDAFAALGEVGFDGLCILQAWRGEDYLEDARRQFEFVKNFIQPKAK